MTIFNYIALRNQSEIVNGKIEAEDPKAAREAIRAMGLIPTKVFDEGKKAAAPKVRLSPLSLQELIDFIGYNPVIDIDWSAPENQILSILSNIAQYQKWVDKNYETARNLASWDLRIQQIKTILSQNGY